MTIFLQVLKELFNIHLSALSKILDSQSKSEAPYIPVFFSHLLGVNYNETLSSEKKRLIDDLIKEISKFEGTESDDENQKSLNNIIEKTYDSIRDLYKNPEIKEKCGKSGTLDILQELTLNSQNFLKDLKIFNKLDVSDNSSELNLINNVYRKAPEYIIYSRAAYYVGENMFFPQSGSKNIRALKEFVLQSRVQALSESIKPSDDFLKRKKKSLQTLQDLETDNSIIITEKCLPEESHKNTSKNNIKIGVPIFSFFGFEPRLPINIPFINNYKAGRLGQLINKSRVSINNMKPEEYNLNMEEESKYDFYKDYYYNDSMNI